MATAMTMTMTMYHQAVSLQAFTDSYFSPYSALYNHQRQPLHPLHSSQPSYIPHQPQQPHPYPTQPTQPTHPTQHQQQLPGPPASPYLTPTADSCRSPYTHPPTRTRARSRTISLAASPLLHPPQTPAPPSRTPSPPARTPSQSLSSYNVEHHILAPTSILYTSPSPAPGTKTLGASPRGRNIWRFTGAAPSPPASNTPTPKSTPTPTPAPSPSTQPNPTQPTPTPKPSTQPKPTPESLELARAKAASLQRSRARVVAGMILHRVYSHAPRPSSPRTPRTPQRPSPRPQRECESRSPDSVRRDTAPARGRSACTTSSVSAGRTVGGGSRLKEVIYSCYWDEDANEDEDTASEGEGSDAESEGSEGTLVDADSEETAHLEKGQAKAKAFDDVDEA
ncbi:hypothetical protein EYR40_001556 [Pleurotus pulmonarius]|nr:hypothetical protein EYR38_004799 [Pleurotus pulmonarius]KAF4609203.1 hypothetical protein EYR40_001556 [Pleurotus pulmonarius]